MTFSSQQKGNSILGTTELLELNYGSTQEYFTSNSRDITLPAGHALNPSSLDISYKAYPLARDVRTGTDKTKASKVKITLPISAGLQGLLLAGGEGITTAKIIRGFGDPLLSPENFKRYWFSGVIADSEVTGTLMTLTLEDYRYILTQTIIPRLTVQRQCNWSVYETGGTNGKCDLSEPAFTFGFSVKTVLSSGQELVLELPSSGISGQENEDAPGIPGYFTLGKIWETADPANNSFISAHTWDGINPTIKLHTPLSGVLAGSQVSVSWGCDWKAETCKDKFSNLNNMVGCPKLPTVNPATTPVFNKK